MISAWNTRLLASPAGKSSWQGDRQGDEATQAGDASRNTAVERPPLDENGGQLGVAQGWILFSGLGDHLVNGGATPLGHGADDLADYLLHGSKVIVVLLIIQDIGHTLQKHTFGLFAVGSARCISFDVIKGSP